MDLLTLPLSRVLAMIREGEIVDAKSICALHMAVSYPDLLEG
jgi:hypothetical protein